MKFPTQCLEKRNLATRQHVNHCAEPVTGMRQPLAELSRIQLFLGSIQPSQYLCVFFLANGALLLTLAVSGEAVFMEAAAT